MQDIKRVYVVHKTHLDIGFTDFSQNVLDNYVNHFIPKAIDVAHEVNTPDMPKQFVWTVGSYLIKYYLEHAGIKEREKLEKAIEAGYVDWHLLPCTTHTELMDSALLHYGISIGKELDIKYKKNHFTAKMTDVPGHTLAMVPYLAKCGIRYLHIGINASSRALEIPELCVLKYGDDELILNYAKDYGQPCIIKEIALEFAHTADNIGPPDASVVKEELERLRIKYPNADIISSGLEGFAAEVLAYKKELPVITQELGDTWIHGSAADPYKTALFCELKNLRKAWIKKEPQAINSKEYNRFMENLLMLCEHTYGLDSKKYLFDFKNWDKQDFLEARRINLTGQSNLAEGGPVIEAFIKKELKTFGKNDLTGSYQVMEHSWDEQRSYLDHAIQVLPENLMREAAIKKEELRPVNQTVIVNQVDYRMFELKGWKVIVLNDGSLRIKSKDNKVFENSIIGKLSYETYDYHTVNACYKEYNRNFETEGEWAEPDFAKPGLNNSKTARNSCFSFIINGLGLEEDRIIVSLKGEAVACSTYGCPRKAEIIYKFKNEAIEISIRWFDKDSNRLPEATYFGFQFDDYEELMVQKLGLPINPLNVIDGGNKKLHAVELVSGKYFEVLPKHSPLLSVGGRNLYNTGDHYGNLQEGLHFILQNNRWNTNFPLWYEQNAAFDFTVLFKQVIEFNNVT